MFTGIIQTTGQISSIQRFRADWRITIEVKDLSFADMQLGDSIAVNGICLTVVHLMAPQFSVDVSAHTLDKTTLARSQIGTLVNLEKCLQLQSYIGGHLVTGHVDGVATLVDKRPAGRTEELIWDVPPALLPLIAVKGSITLDGVSLTVNTLQATQVGVTIIPHTLACTTLGRFNLGEQANVEVDLLARYAARWLSATQTAHSSSQ